jgi:Cu+-exporting ATPase
MSLERKTVSLEPEENPELPDMSRRFWISVALTIPLVVLAMSGPIPLIRIENKAILPYLNLLELVLATPVVLWGGWPLLVRGWQSILNRSLNMFTLIGLGVSVAYVYSVISTTLPGLFPASFHGAGGQVSTYFEAAASITTLVLLGQVLELSVIANSLRLKSIRL